MSTIFISYRREQTAGEARALLDNLDAMLGKGSAFMDVENISLGRDFRLVLQENLASCGLMIVLIGKDWLHAKNEAGQVRLENPNDFVRLEITSALKRNIPVAPVLVQGARMPTAEQLPEDLRDLSYRQDCELSHNRWASDVQEMIKRLELRPISPPVADPVSTTPPRTESLSNKKWLKWAVGGVAVLAVVGWVVVGYNTEKVQPSQMASPPNSESQDRLSALITGTPAFYSCTSRNQCTSGTACVDDGGDKSYYCKPYCSDDPECANVRIKYPGVRCLPLKGSNLQICNDLESSLIPKP